MSPSIDEQTLKDEIARLETQLSAARAQLVTTSKANVSDHLTPNGLSASSNAHLPNHPYFSSPTVPSLSAPLPFPLA